MYFHFPHNFYFLNPRIQGDIIICVGLSACSFSAILTKLEFSQISVKKNQHDIKKIRPTEAGLFHAGRHVQTTLLKSPFPPDLRKRLKNPNICFANLRSDRLSSLGNMTWSGINTEVPFKARVISLIQKTNIT